MKVNVRYKKITNGRSSIYLDSPGLQPRRKYLGEFVYDKPKTAKERDHNKSIMAIVEHVVSELETKIRNSKHRIVEDRTSEDFIEYYLYWQKAINTSNPRRAQSVYLQLQSFLAQHRIKKLYGYQVTKQLCEDFAHYLKSRLNGESPRTYFTKFKQCLKRAYTDKVIEFNPRDITVSLPVDNAIKKPLLSEDEIKLLATAKTENIVVKHAFFVSLLMGFDFTTVKTLTSAHIDLSRNEIIYERSKVERGRRKPMTESVRKIIEARMKDVQPDEPLFKMGSWNGAMDTMRAMAKRVGITKKFTWHSARHSFATNLLEKEVDIRVISDLLDHKNLKTTMRYTEVGNKIRRKALEKLDEIELDELK